MSFAGFAVTREYYINDGGTQVDVLCVDGSTQSGELCTLPMYDADRLIPRGKLVDIPTIPIASE